MKEGEGTHSDQEEPVVSFAEHIVAISEEFDVQAMARHKMDGEKYGPGQFLTVDTIQEALDEIVDLANYARYTYIRLRLLQDAILDALPDGADSTPGQFITAKKLTEVHPT